MSRYFKNIWEGIFTVLIGMKVTLRHLFVPAVTIQYPTVKLKLPERARNRLYVNMDDCIGCDQCSMACPVDCITIETLKSTPDIDLGLTSVGTKKRLYVPRFDIDIAKCCYCGLCVPPCPTECIKMTDVFEFSEYERGNLIYNYAVMTPKEIDEAKAKLTAHEKDQAAKKSAAPSKPIAPPAPTQSGPAPRPVAPAPTPSGPAPRPSPVVGTVSGPTSSPKENPPKDPETTS